MEPEVSMSGSSLFQLSEGVNDALSPSYNFLRGCTGLSRTSVLPEYTYSCIPGLL